MSASICDHGLQRAIKELDAALLGPSLYAWRGKASGTWYVTGEQALHEYAGGIGGTIRLLNASVAIEAEWWTPNTQFAIADGQKREPHETFEGAEIYGDLNYGRYRIVTVDLQTGEEVPA